METLLFSEFTLARDWKRVVAQLIDLGLVVLIAIVLSVMIGWRIPSRAMAFWTYFVVFLVYSVILDSYRQGTVGKLMMGLKVVEASGIRSILLTSLYRNLLKSVMILFGVGGILLFVGKQGIHNRVTNCVVIDGGNSTSKAGNSVDMQ